MIYLARITRIYTEKDTKDKKICENLRNPRLKNLFFHFFYLPLQAINLNNNKIMDDYPAENYNS
jgi:hypothetical protein